MNPTTCKCCGQTLPTPYPKGVRLPKVQLAIFEAIRKAGKHGIARARVREVVYADDPEGGPEFDNVISVHVQRINKALNPAGLKIQSSRGRGNSCYKLLEI